MRRALLKRLCWSFFGTAAISISPQSASAQSRPSYDRSNGRATVSIVEPINLTNLNPLDFGCMKVLGEGEVTVDVEGRRISYEGAVNPNGDEMCLAEPARFVVSGDRLRAYRFNVQHDAVAFHSANTMLSLKVLRLKGKSKNDPQGINTGILDNDGIDMLFVGGTLLVPKGAVSGRYLAKVSVSVAYM